MQQMGSRSDESIGAASRDKMAMRPYARLLCILVIVIPLVVMVFCDEKTLLDESRAAAP